MKIKWSRKEGYQINSKTDKRFSPFFCYLRDGKSIEWHYQVSVKGYSSIEEGKGKLPLNKLLDPFTQYCNMWRAWAKDHPVLIEELFELVKQHDNTLGDFFASTETNQAHALSLVLNETFLGHKRIIVAGSRSITDYKALCSALNELAIPTSTIISGGAVGVDSLAIQFAKENKIPVEIYYPDWNRLGRRAGMVRNAEMAKRGHVLLAMWDGVSVGTKAMIEMAKNNGLDVIVKTTT